MCDTLWKKQSEYSIFLKNSDRSPNEPNLCIFFHSGEARGEVDCTYIKIPDPNKHYATLLIKPSWTWGAEMGINEFGVSIGNEAVFTKSKGKKTSSLIGMDFVRLALERCKDAKSATDEIVRLLKEYGQGGNCGFDHEFYYDNSYLISDYTESYILETAGKEYAIKQVKDYANISNRLTLSNDITDSSVQEDFTNKFTEPIYTFFSGSADRIKSANESISSIESYDLQKYFNTLRQHIVTQKRAIEKGSVKSVCMHAGGRFGDHTTGSMV
jgi:dipeptidase